MSLAAAPVLPARYQVVERQEETHDTVTLRLRPVDQPIPAYQPGQFTMLYAPGIGEVPISISGMGPGLALVQTVRAVGAVTRALCACPPGRVIGLRGPYGTDWDVADAAGDDLLIVAGGIGLAPLRGPCSPRSGTGGGTGASWCWRVPGHRRNSSSPASWSIGAAAVPR